MARSPDINPIENMFNNVRKKLRRDAIKHHIEHESYEEFCNRVKTTILNFTRDVIDSTIESLPKRMKLIMKGKVIAQNINTYSMLELSDVTEHLNAALQ